MIILPKKIRRVPAIMWAMLFYGTVMLALNQWEPASLNVFYQANYILVGLAFFACYFEKHDENSLSYVLNGMAIGCLIQSLFGLLGYFNSGVYPYLIQVFAGPMHIPVYDAAKKGLIGTLGNGNLFGAYIGITSVALFRKKWAWFLPIVFVVILLSKSEMGLLTMLSGALYYSYKKYTNFNSYLPFLAVFTIFIALYNFGAGGLDTGRFAIWAKSFSFVDTQHFSIGKGAGWFADKGVMKKTTHVLKEHNEIIALFNVFGIIGLAIFASMLKKVIPKDPKEFIFPAALFACFFNFFGHFTLHQSTTAVIFIVVASICLGQSLRGEYVKNLDW